MSKLVLINRTIAKNNTSRSNLIGSYKIKSSKIFSSKKETVSKNQVLLTKYLSDIDKKLFIIGKGGEKRGIYIDESDLY